MYFHFVQFGVTWFNTHSDYLEYRNKFGGKKIGLIIINSCNNEFTITRKILDLLRGAGPAKTVDLSNRILGKLIHASMEKLRKSVFAEQRLRSAWASAQFDQNIRCALNR